MVQVSPRTLRRQRRRFPFKEPTLLFLLVVFLLLAGTIWMTMMMRGPPIIENDALQQECFLLRQLLSSDHASQKLSNLFKSTRVPKEDITLVTQVSANKLDILLLQIVRWQGPVSCAVYIQTQKQADKLLEFAQVNQKALEKTTLHVLMERPGRNVDYPINELRNLALDNIQSDYFLAMDVDFLTDAWAYSELKDALTTTPEFRSKLRSKTLFVLPAFERFMPSQLRGGNNNTITMDMMPQNKQDLLDMVASGEAAPFHAKFVPGHGPTNYTKWYIQQEFSYPIDFALRFEPYVVAYRYGVPRYWPRFRGFGYNKASWFCELHYLGYQYRVLRDHYVIHKNHPYSNSRRQNTATLLEWLAFKKYMIETYHAPKDVFRDYADRYGSNQWREYMGGNITDARPWYNRMGDLLSS